MLRLTIANAIAHRSRLALTWLAVTLGVAFATGSLVLTDTSSALLDEQFRKATTGVDVCIRTAAAFDSAMGVQVQRAPVPPDTALRVAAIPGVEAVRGTASGTGQLQAGAASPAADADTLIDTWGETPFTAYRLVAGRAPQAADEVVLDRATARADSVAVGDVITVTAFASRNLRVVGFAGVGDGDGLPNTHLVLVELPAAQALLGLGSGLSAIEVTAEPDISVAALRAQIASTLGSRYAVTNGQDTIAATADAAQQSVSLLRLVLLALAGAGLVVGAFLIANTFGIVVAQRSRELALLRASGATGRQVFWSVLGEAALVGAIGAVSGMLAGIGAASALRGLAGVAGLTLPDGPLVIRGATVLAVVVTGTMITVLSAVAPARKAARTAPVEAMRVSDAALGAPRRGRLITGGALVSMSMLLLGLGATTGALASVGLGALGLLIALAVLGPVLAPRLSSVVGRPLSTLGVPGVLARESSRRNPRRTSSTALALALGLALITFVTVLDSSVKAAVGSSYREVITADLVIESSRNEMLGGLSPEVARRAGALPGVASTTAIRYGHWLDGGMANALTAIDPAAIGAVANIRMVKGNLDALASGGVVLAAKDATSRGLHVGDRLSMTFPNDGRQEIPVVGIMEDASAGALGSNQVLSLGAYARHYNEDVDASVLVVAEPGTDPTRLRAALQRSLATFPNAEVRDLASAAASRTAALDQVISMITVLLGFAVLIALLGITNTLALSIVERMREIGLLRAVGMTRRQVRAMIRAEAILVSGVSVVIGAAVGLVLATSVLTALAATMTLTTRVPLGPLAALVLITLAAGLVAGVLPARRAARLDVLTAIATQ